ncbi:DUF6975 family protein [Allosphingosinicella indica]|uniref:Uncharacterized protein n=1 Tax=Allosphingosinicella indica TaxID=941907 RepID=A0A1X7H2J2_9SPHN|nr:hypothetical protein [Allosphingosinicella indica]SMF78681.1 hypothetical protein SAMN06295910_2738 [Allosphingosinicella indica]
MATASFDIAGAPRPGELLRNLVARSGSASHPYLWSAALRDGPEASSNLADAIHFLCTLHGRHPGAIDHAANRTPDQDARAWLEDAISAFAIERGYLTHLAVAAGPVPGTPGAADSDAALLAQRNAIAMLACSERRGCAFGAALALALDWAEVRTVVDLAAARFGVEAPPYVIGNADRIAEAADRFAVAPPLQRALLFGAEQISIQHRGLWDLLEARQQARALA